MTTDYHELEQRQLLEAIRTQFNENYFFNNEQADNDTPQTYGNIYKTPAFSVCDMENTFIDLNKSFEYVGDNSTFQKRITWILSIQWVAFTFIVMGMTYVFREPKFICTSPNGSSYICSQDIAYDGVEVKTSFPSTQYSVIEEFDLICAKENLVTTAQTLFFLGGWVSGYLLNYLSDKIGRRSVLIIAMSLATTAVLACAVAQSFEVFMVGYFFSGFGLFGYETNVYIYISEISAIRFRTISVNILTIVWAGAPIFFPLMNLLPSWRYLFFCFATPLLVSLPFMYKCFLESPRFLVNKGCFKQARQIFREISITNRRPPYEFRLIEEMDFENNSLTHINSEKDRHKKKLINESNKKKKRTYNYLDLFRYESLRKLTLTLMWLWLVRYFMYYAINLGMEAIVNSGFVLTVVISISALVEVVGAFGIPVMTTYLFHKRKIDIMRLSLLMTSIFCLVLWFISIPQECRTEKSICPQLTSMVVLVMLIKLFITVFYSGLISYGSQIFPTDVRSLGSGFTLTFGRLGTLIVPPYIKYMKIHYFGKNPLSFLAPWTFLAYILCRRMPATETEGMRQHVQEQRESNVFRAVEMQNVGMVPVQSYPQLP